MATHRFLGGRLSRMSALQRLTIINLNFGNLIWGSSTSFIVDLALSLSSSHHHPSPPLCSMSSYSGELLDSILLASLQLTRSLLSIQPKNQKLPRPKPAMQHQQPLHP